MDLSFAIIEEKWVLKGRKQSPYYHLLLASSSCEDERAKCFSLQEIVQIIQKFEIKILNLTVNDMWSCFQEEGFEKLVTKVEEIHVFDHCLPDVYGNSCKPIDQDYIQKITEKHSKKYVYHMLK
jgi:hypothetical protein